MRKLQIVVSVVCVGLILIHMFLPHYKVDSITISLIIIALLSWLAPSIESFKAPGGWEIKLRELQILTEKAKEVGLIEEQQIQSTDTASYTFQSVAVEDPNLALVGLRIEIEKRLRNMAEALQIQDATISVGRLLRELTARHALSQSERAILSDLVILLNRAAHGAEVDNNTAQWAISVGPSLLSSLDSRRYP